MVSICKVISLTGSLFRRNLENGGGGTFRGVTLCLSRFKVLVCSIDPKKRGVLVSGPLQQRA